MSRCATRQRTKRSNAEGDVWYRPSGRCSASGRGCRQRSAPSVARIRLAFALEPEGLAVHSRGSSESAQRASDNPRYPAPHACATLKGSSLRARGCWSQRNGDPAGVHGFVVAGLRFRFIPAFAHPSSFILHHSEPALGAGAVEASQVVAALPACARATAVDPEQVGGERGKGRKREPDRYDKHDASRRPVDPGGPGPGTDRLAYAPLPAPKGLV